MSADDTAQQRSLPGATRQISLSFFMQKPYRLGANAALVVVIAANVQTDISTQVFPSRRT